MAAERNLVDWYGKRGRFNSHMNVWMNPFHSFFFARNVVANSKRAANNLAWHTTKSVRRQQHIILTCLPLLPVCTILCWQLKKCITCSNAFAIFYTQKACALTRFIMIEMTHAFLLLEPIRECSLHKDDNHNTVHDFTQIEFCIPMVQWKHKRPYKMSSHESYLSRISKR